jgi:hypothetical protein
MEAAARVYRAFFLSYSDDLACAEREIRAVLDGMGAPPPLRAYALAVLGRIRLLDARPHEAEKPARQALGLVDSLGGIEEGESYVRLVFAETLEAVGENDAAREAVATARVRLLERAANIRDAAWRESFLERVPENARTLALARERRVT